MDDGLVVLVDQDDAAPAPVRRGHGLDELPEARPVGLAGGRGHAEALGLVVDDVVDGRGEARGLEAGLVEFDVDDGAAPLLSRTSGFGKTPVVVGPQPGEELAVARVELLDRRERELGSSPGAPTPGYRKRRGRERKK